MTCPSCAKGVPLEPLLSFLRTEPRFESHGFEGGRGPGPRPAFRVRRAEDLKLGQTVNGHNTGIYSFMHLREICPYEECKK